MQLDIFSTNKPTSTTPKERILSACAWASENYPYKWMKLVSLCEKEAYRGSKCLRRGDLFMVAQLQGLSMSVAEEYKFDNNIWAPISRYLLMFRPRLAQVIHPILCDLDTYDFEKIWHENVHANTFFPVSTWQQAVHAYETEDVCAS